MNILPKNPVKTLITIAYIVAFFAFLAYVAPKLITYFLPFIVAWLIAQIINPIVKFLEKLHIHRRIGVIASILCVITLLGYIIYFLSAALVRELKTVLEFIQVTTSEGIPVFIQEFIEILPKNVKVMALELIENARINLSDFVYPSIKSAISGLGGAAGKLPSAFVFTIALILATYFISYDEPNIKNQIKKLIPDGKLEKISFIKLKLLKACGGYLKAQAILMSIVFCILLTGFLILDVKLALILALVISLWDAVPVLGSGIILNPWAVINLLQGNYFQAVGFFCLYLIILFTRQLLEPKILSGQLGIHPLFTLTAIYVGLKTMGIPGMILGPIILIIVINILKFNQESGEGDDSSCQKTT